MPAFTVTSEDVTDGQPLKDDQVPAAGNTSPQLTWSGAPEGTQSFTVTCFDPDAPTPWGFWHWVLVRHPGRRDLARHRRRRRGRRGLPGGAFMCRNDGGPKAFMGAAPPEATRSTATSSSSTR